ncbi:MAG: hypothetical protein ACE141_18460 [Bryobacteraceae bacterium]
MVVRVQLKPKHARLGSVRVRLKPVWPERGAVERAFALALGAVLTPASAMAAALAFWRLGSDLNWTGQFAISRGLFSHWQVWLAVAVLLQLGASVLNRYGRGGGREAMP